MENKQKFYSKRNRRFSFRAFTVIELLVVFAVFGLVISLIIVSVKGATGKARIATILQFAGTINHTLGAYAMGIWDFNEGSGNDVKDSSSNGNNGVWQGGAGWEPNGGIAELRSAGKFTGSNYVQVLTSDTLNPGLDSWTVSFWFKCRAASCTGTAGSLVFKGVSPDPHWSIVANSNSGVVTEFGSAWPNYNRVMTAAVSPISNWTHYVVIFDRTKQDAIVYGNGKILNYLIPGTEGDLRGLPSITNNDLVIIGQQTPAPRLTDHLIDEVRIYRASLTSYQVQKLFAEGAEKRGLVAK